MLIKVNTFNTVWVVKGRRLNSAGNKINHKIFIEKSLLEHYFCLFYTGNNKCDSKCP